MRKPVVAGCLFFFFCQSLVCGSENVEETLNQSNLEITSTEAEAPQPMPYTAPQAAPLPASSPSTSPIMLNSRFQIGANYTRVSIHPHHHTTFTGNLGGAQALYEFCPVNRFYGGVKVAWKEGMTHSEAGKRSLLYVDAQERLGYTLSCYDEDLLLTFYSGLGYKHFGQKFSPKSGASTLFRYNELYFPLGAMADYAFKECFAVGLSFVWMPQIYPTVKIVPLKGARWIIRNQLANFYVEMPFTFTLSADKRFSLIIKPFYEYWKDGRTTAKTPSGVSLGIPANTYNFGGVDVNVAYSF